MAWNIPPEVLKAAEHAAKRILEKKTAAKWLRVSAGLNLLEFIGMRELRGKRELPNPMEHNETREVWRSLWKPMHQLAAFAESKGIDSTPLLSLHACRYFDDIDKVRPLIDRLELLESGPPSDGDEGEFLKKKKTTSPKGRRLADKVRSLLTGPDPFEGTKTDLARAVGYTQPASLVKVKNFVDLWDANEVKLEGRRLERSKRMSSKANL